ncbi:MAG: NHLP family bacteriocin export ABC transporter peptidase/permease/ATPase, partial [Rhodobiaceae bacterium]|nr:NHLP family bacteriocin export ABC transporter peptidase/permease/ATPase [Rhodobiaceae bacterium]
MADAALAGGERTARARGVRAPRNRGKRARTPTFLQLEAAECGAASLGMVLGYYGRFVSLETLRELCGVSRDGSKASSVLKAARRFGLNAKGLKAEPEHLRQLQMPAIAFVNFSHFLVVEGISGKTVWLNDPASGRRRVSLEEFDAMFTGVILTFSPGPDFTKGDDRPSNTAALFARTHGVRLAVVYAILASLALIVPGLALPVMSRIFVDYVLIQEIGDWLWPLVGGMLATAVIRYLLVILRDWYLVRAETRLAVDGARDLFSHILRLPLSFFGVRYAGEIASRLDLSDDLARLLTGQVAQILLNLFTASFFLILMAIYDVGIAAIVLALSLVNVVGVVAVSRSVVEAHRKAALDRGKLVGVTLAGLRDIETFKASGAESSFFSRWSGL